MDCSGSHRDPTAWLRRQPDSNPSLQTPANLQKQEKFRNAGNANARLAKDTGFQQVEQCPPASGSREIAGQEQGKSRQEQVPPSVKGIIDVPLSPITRTAAAA